MPAEIAMISLYKMFDPGLKISINGPGIDGDSILMDYARIPSKRLHTLRCLIRLAREGREIVWINRDLRNIE